MRTGRAVATVDSVTLILGMSKPEGVYMSVDHRVTLSGTRRIVTDAASKLVHVHYPPHDRGVRALFAFTGDAVLPDGTPTGQWIRETMRGECEGPNESLAHLRERLGRDFGRFRKALIVNFLAVQDERRSSAG